MAGVAAAAAFFLPLAGVDFFSGGDSYSVTSSKIFGSWTIFGRFGSQRHSAMAAKVAEQSSLTLMFCCLLRGESSGAFSMDSANGFGFRCKYPPAKPHRR